MFRLVLSHSQTEQHKMYFICVLVQAERMAEYQPRKVDTVGI